VKPFQAVHMQQNMNKTGGKNKKNKKNKKKGNGV
jgi:hypothetical protein